MRFIDSADEVADLQGECALMQRCSNHANVVPFIGACRDGGTYCIVSAFCAGTKKKRKKERRKKQYTVIIIIMIFRR